MAGEHEQGLAEAFWGVARRLRHQTREVLAPWDIAPSHSRALDVLTRGEALRLSELSERLHVAPRSATELVDALEARGLAARRADPADRRAVLVELTDHGREVGRAISTARSAAAERFFGELSAEDRERLARILHGLLEGDPDRPS